MTLGEQLEALHKRIERTLNPFTMMLTTRKLSLSTLTKVHEELLGSCMEIERILKENKK